VTAERLEAIRQELVAGNRILARRGVVDAFGHVSARHPNDPERFLLARRLAPALVNGSDILEFTLDGEPAGADARPVFVERFIHSEIYAVRPDVQAIVHCHSHGAIAFSVVPSQPLRAVCHTCGFLGGDVPVFEMRDVAGPATDLLIRNRELGAALASSLGAAAVVLMRGHGLTAVGHSIAHAVYRAIFTEANAAIQQDASRLGDVTFLSEAEAAAAERTADLQVERCWQLWNSEIG
jgi:HCOMODA/2-hydroxy-3-carboxy-muconic semialdehyde decarboxylase